MSDGEVTREQAEAAYDNIPWQTFGTQMCKDAKAALERGDFKMCVFYSEGCLELLDKWRDEY